jgi:hypothetical protein
LLNKSLSLVHASAYSSKSLKGRVENPLLLLDHGKKDGNGEEGTKGGKEEEELTMSFVFCTLMSWALAAPRVRPFVEMVINLPVSLS